MYRPTVQEKINIVYDFTKTEHVLTSWVYISWRTSQDIYNSVQTLGLKLSKS
jgi:hypothetical protein